MRFLPALIILANLLPASDPLGPDGNPFSVPTASSLGGTKDSTTRADSLATIAKAVAAPPRPVYHAPDWSWEICPRLGMIPADFPERSNFASDISRSAQAESLTVQQPYPGSDIAIRTGVDFTVRRSNSFRVVVGTDWTHWSAEAIAQRDSTGRLVNRSYTSDLLLGSVGMDLLISPAVLTVDAARDVFFGFRYRAGAGRLVGRQSVWGFSSGTTFLLGADFAAWQRLALSGTLGLNTQSTRSDRPWSDVLWNTPTKSSTRWSAGGLSLEFLLRWGPSRDTSSVQKK
ncbi:MAG TPA: hypothetical protein PKO15_11260 [Fibrobacteria bacterium]|nr:hypothetical protein [Fibrobacteria bacterium]HOX51731.1 hypothetical protein [Fibrobacteria bacterium]